LPLGYTKRAFETFEKEARWKKGEGREQGEQNKEQGEQRKEEGGRVVVFVITIEVRISSRHQVVMLNVGVA
jgi:hypothetical protein